MLSRKLQEKRENYKMRIPCVTHDTAYYQADKIEEGTYGHVACTEIIKLKLPERKKINMSFFWIS